MIMRGGQMNVCVHIFDFARKLDMGGFFCKDYQTR